MTPVTVTKKPIISADSHIAEPRDMYTGRVSKKYADNVPKVVQRPQGGDVFQIPEMESFPITIALAAGKRGAEIVAQGFAKLDDCLKGGSDPKQRLIDQDRDGISAEMLYPSLGMFLCNHPDVAYKSELFRAYNEWVAEFCATAPDRLFGIGQTAMGTPEDGVEDLKEIKKLGLRGVMLPGHPAIDDYDSKIYDPVWEAAIDLNLPVSFHILSYKDGLGKPRGPKMNNFVSTLRGNQDVIGMFILSGVFERYPQLKLVCAEADAGWVPHYTSRMDHVFKRFPQQMGDVKLSHLPSAYFRENVYLTFQDDVIAFKMKDLFNKERICWASDFPHLDSTWPWSQDLLNDYTTNLSTDEKDKLLHDNVAALYSLPI